ncbi:GntR family transcriptional regulator [Labrys miyagiensis]
MESRGDNHALEILAARGKAAQSGLRSSMRRVTTATAIYDDLREAIVSMRLVPGTPLQERALTQRFGVSKTPMREALIRLAEDGLVDIFPQSGTFVSHVRVAEIPESTVIRQSLEQTAVRRTAEIADAADMARLDAILARQRMLADLGDTNAFHEADEAFHEAIALIAGYPNIPRLLRQVKVQIDRARRLTLPVAGRMHQVIGEHHLIRDAIARHDVEAACAALKAHLGVMQLDIGRLRLEFPDYFV